MKILADASLPSIKDYFPEPFSLTVYHNAEELRQQLANQDILLCRSTLKVNEELLSKSSLAFVATASSGSDHMDTEFLRQKNIHFYDAKGCNAQAVTDYVVSVLAWLEKNKEIVPHLIGIIGVGAVGSLIASRLESLGFKTLGYDPYKERTHLAQHLQDLIECDLILIHANLHHNYPYSTQHLIGKTFLNGLKKGSVIINAARGDIVDEKALLTYGSSILYCTDVYQCEPHIDKKIVDYAALCTPHIAGHSIEAKLRAIQILSFKIHHHLNLSPPKMSPIHSETDTPITLGTWKETVLSLYNPFVETQTLKQALDLTEAFLRTRKNHHFRHDFNWGFS